MAVEPNGSNLDVNRCPAPTGYGSALAVASTGGAAVLAEVETCRKMYMQASVSNVVNVTFNMGAAATSNCMIIPQAVASGLISAGVGASWMEIPCPSTTVPQFHAMSDDESVRCLWYR